MKTKLISVLLLLFIIQEVAAQKELWGYRTNEHIDFYPNMFPGEIIRIPLAYNGTSFQEVVQVLPENQIMHAFDPTSLLGKYPYGRLFEASNGKLYGMTSYMRDTFITEIPSNVPFSVLFEYDLVTNNYRVVHSFSRVDNNYAIYRSQHRITSLIEPTPGVIIGVDQQSSIFKYNLSTDIVTTVKTFTPFTSSTFSYITSLSTEFIKATDGNLYAAVDWFKLPNGFATNNGGFIKYNYTTNVHQFIENTGDAFPNQNGVLVEGLPGKFYFTSAYGGFYSANCPTGCGGIIEFDINTNIATRKYDFNIDTVGFYSSNLRFGGDNKLYGTLLSLDSVSSTAPNKDGSIYQYDFVTNTFSVIKSYGAIQDRPRLLLNRDQILKTSDDNYYFITRTELTRYNPITNESRLITENKISSENQQFVSFMPGFIEICRKPSYQEILVNTYTPEVGSTFTYNINNNNATTYVWKKGTTILPLQTSGILTLTNVTTNDSGVYSCTMTNECGTTITANLSINVSNLGTDTIDNYKQQITLYPNPTKGNINLKFPENKGLKGLKYKITNLLGQVIQEKNIGNLQNKSEVTIDSSLFTTGVYQVTLTTDKGDWNGKFVKE